MAMDSHKMDEFEDEQENPPPSIMTREAGEA
jgi:hypothetical protein